LLPYVQNPSAQHVRLLPGLSTDTVICAEAPVGAARQRLCSGTALTSPANRVVRSWQNNSVLGLLTRVRLTRYAQGRCMCLGKRGVHSRPPDQGSVGRTSQPTKAQNSAGKAAQGRDTRRTKPDTPARTEQKTSSNGSGHPPHLNAAEERRRKTPRKNAAEERSRRRPAR